MNYTKLCTKTLEKNKSALNLWLAKDGDRDAAIAAIALTNSDDAEKIEVEELSLLYMTNQKL